MDQVKREIQRDFPDRSQQVEKLATEAKAASKLPEPFGWLQVKRGETPPPLIQYRGRQYRYIQGVGYGYCTTSY